MTADKMLPPGAEAMDAYELLSAAMDDLASLETRLRRGEDVRPHQVRQARDTVQIAYTKLEDGHIPGMEW